MKKIFTYLAVAALMAVACDDMYGPVETPTAPDKAGSVEIQIDTLGDDTLAFTIAPVGEASYFSYMVAAGPAQAVDSVAVYECKAGGLIKGTFKASEVSDTTLTLGELAPNTSYTIYAVAGSLQGIPGSVAVKEVKTTDGIAIGVTSFDAVTDSSVVLSFSENVFLGEGKITATYYASNLGYQAMGTVEAVADSVLVDGKTVTVQFAGLPHGAHWAVSWPEGMFTDSANNKIAALNSGYSADDKKFVGVSARKDTVAFDLDAALPEEMLMFSDWSTAMFQVGVAVDSTLAAPGKGKVVAEYHTPGKVITIDLALNQHYMFGATGVAMACPEDPGFGTTVVFSFAQDAFQDIWGNPTKAVDYVTLCAYDYTVQDIVGSYEYVAYSAYGYPETNGTLAIALSDDSAKGNVMFTTMYSTPCEKNVYATFVPASGELMIASPQHYGTGDTYAYGFGTADGSGSPSTVTAVLKMPEKGTLMFEAESYFIGDMAMDPTTLAVLGAFDLYYYFEATAVSAPAEPSAMVRTLKPALK